MANGLIFKNAEEAKDAIMASQKKEIAALYNEWADEIGERAKFYSHKSTASAPVTERYFKELQKQLRATSQEVSNEIYTKIKGNMYLMSDAVIKDNVDWLSSFGFSKDGINAAFSLVPDSIVRNLITGQVYESGWSLSKRIWSDNEATLKDIYQVMARGLAENKGIYEIAKDLEAYVRPDARLPWNLKMKDGVKIFKKQVDYNAQRLARTLTQHTYQQTFVATTQKNPFVLDYIWHSNGSRACELCKSRDGQHYKKDELPMDHPNGMCVMEPNVSKDMTDQLTDWFNSPDGTFPEIDAFAGNFGYEAKTIGSVNDFVNKYGMSTKSPSAWFNSLTQIQKAEAKALKDKSGMTWNAWYEKYVHDTGDASLNFAKKYGTSAKSPSAWFNSLPADIKAEAKLAKESTGLTWNDWYEKYILNGGSVNAPAKKVPVFSDIQEKYLKPYGFTKDNMPTSFDDWSHKVSYEQASEILKSMGTSWGDAHPYQQLMKFYEKNLTDKNFVAGFADTTKKAATTAKKAGSKSKFDSSVWKESVRRNNLSTMDDWCREWLNDVSYAERNGVEVYTGSAYRDMNRYLRGQSHSTNYKDEIKNATSALKKASLPEETIVRRGSDFNMLEELGLDISEQNKDKFVGAIVTEKGFLSTSPAPSGGFSGDIEYVIKVPKGSQAMYVDSISRHRGEEELLINRGGKFIVEDVEFGSYGNVKRIYMTLKNLKGTK